MPGSIEAVVASAAFQSWARYERDGMSAQAEAHRRRGRAALRALLDKLEEALLEQARANLRKES